MKNNNTKPIASSFTKSMINSEAQKTILQEEGAKKIRKLEEKNLELLTELENYKNLSTQLQDENSYLKNENANRQTYIDKLLAEKTRLKW